MRLSNEFIQSLVEEENPLPLLWSYLRKNIWTPSKGQSLQDYYDEGEKKTTALEETINKIYGEIYTNHIPYYCRHAYKDIAPEEDQTLLIMDAMSLREAGLLISELQEEGYAIQNETFGTASLPSDTNSFRDKIQYSQLKNQLSHVDVKNQDPDIVDDIRLIWCRFPDSYIENIQEGTTQISTLEETFRKTREVFFKIVNQIDGPVLVTSDHGYVRTEAGYTFTVSDSVKSKLRDAFGNNRSVTSEELPGGRGEELTEESACVNYGDDYVARARTTWPMHGKYSVYSHGGTSLLEVITPKFIVRKNVK